MGARELLRELGLDVDVVKTVESSGRWICNTTFWREVYPPLDPTECKGVYVKDVYGRTYIDMVGGVAARPFGYNDPEYLAFAKKAIELPFALVSQDFDHIFQTLLARELAETHPDPDGVEVGFGTSGGRANEFAVKSVIDRTGKSKFICFSPSFHGRTGFTLPLTNSKSVQRERYPISLEVYRFDYVNDYQVPPAL
jgi:4-aminobutyrate aminotransferase-like enzyme